MQESLESIIFLRRSLCPTFHMSHQPGSGWWKWKEKSHTGDLIQTGSKIPEFWLWPAWCWDRTIDWLGSLFENRTLFSATIFPEPPPKFMEESTCMFPRPSRGAGKELRAGQGRRMDKGERCQPRTGWDYAHPVEDWGTTIIFSSSDSESWLLF